MSRQGQISEVTGLLSDVDLSAEVTVPNDENCPCWTKTAKRERPYLPKQPRGNVSPC